MPIGESDMDLETIQTSLNIAGNAATICTIAAGAWWFLNTTQYKPRIQFDLDCSFFRGLGRDGDLAVEIGCVFENKGFVEHRLYDLTVSVHALEAEQQVVVREGNRQIEFARRLLPSTPMVPPQIGYFFVRPGVRQAITHIIRIPADVSMIRITAGFRYHRHSAYPHTARRLFAVPQGRSRS